MSPGVRKDTPPSKHAMEVLARAARAPFPSQECNFTVRNKLVLHGYAETFLAPSPYATHQRKRGPVKRIDFLRATDAGRAALSAAKLKAREIAPSALANGGERK